MRDRAWGIRCISRSRYCRASQLGFQGAIAAKLCSTLETPKAAKATGKLDLRPETHASSTTPGAPGRDDKRQHIVQKARVVLMVYPAFSLKAR